MQAFGRAMLDATSFKVFCPNATYNYQVYKQCDLDLKGNEKDYAICSPFVLGFNFGSKRWGKFHFLFSLKMAADRIAGGIGLDYCRPINWSSDAFSSLVLESNKKKLIYSLVTQHMLKNKKFDDFVAGKGRGLVGLLSGRPGCGKTLTAEAISEQTRQPLYSVSAGELGTNPSDVDRQLTLVLELAQRWNAILLLDEADVFLQARNDTDVVRNALVSIFLRQIEYFTGIMILTTNRIGSFDPAFES
jgi:ATPase family associated with various cellular activities (AAA)